MSGLSPYDSLRISPYLDRILNLPNYRGRPLSIRGQAAAMHPQHVLPPLHMNVKPDHSDYIDVVSLCGEAAKDAHSSNHEPEQVQDYEHGAGRKGHDRAQPNEYMSSEAERLITLVPFRAIERTSRDLSEQQGQKLNSYSLSSPDNNKTLRAFCSYSQHSPKSVPLPLTTLDSADHEPISPISSAPQTQSFSCNIIELLNDICREAARRKWIGELERRQVKRLIDDASGQNYHPNKDKARKRAIWHRKGRDLYSPYPLPSPGRTQNRSHENHECEKWTSDDQLYQPRSLMAYISLIANATWENAMAHAAAPHRAEWRAAEEMSILYELARKVTEGLEGAMESEECYVGDDPQRDPIEFSMAREAGELCGFLGYADGKMRCEELLAGWCDGGEVV